MKGAYLVAALALAACLFAAPRVAAEILLAKGGNTSYRIVKPNQATGVDEYAVQKLAGYLKQMTGAVYPVNSPDSAPADGPAIFVGLSGPMTQRLGDSYPLAPLSEQEYVVRSKGNDIFLYGEGIHGNLNAVMGFLEGLGWRWYSVFERPVVPSAPNLAVQPLDQRKGFTFKRRNLAKQYGIDFYLQNGVNQGYESEYRRKGREKPDYLRSWIPYECFVHSSFRYIPPTPQSSYATTFEWLEKRNYFATNPEFFSMNAQGKRVPTAQLCFANPGLRDELTKNILKHIEVSGDDQYITVDAADHPGKFCHCPACRRLEQQYQSPGGPLYDYLVELCRIMKEKHPTVLAKTLAYRRSQTQKPPILPGGRKLPENLIIDFGPIEDNYFADWSHPDPKIQETYQDLKNWGMVAHHLWAWIYPNPWGTGHYLPVGNVERVVVNFRKMRDAGVTGIYVDHNGYLSRSGFSELQAYLMLHLARDVDLDTGALIEEFTDHQYGPAAPLMRKYLAELEDGRKGMKDLPPGTTYNSRVYTDRQFPYLTVENIHRWQTMFDAMLERVGDDRARTMNISLLRRELDMAVLWKWFALREKYPEYYRDAVVFVERIQAADSTESVAGQKLVRKIGGSTLANFKMMIDTGGKEKPFPPEFDGIDRSRIRTFAISQGEKVKDPDAAFGYATVVDSPDYPFVFGFFQWRSRTPRVVIKGPRVSLDKNRIKPDQYVLHELGGIKIEVTDSLIHMGRSWRTHLEVGALLYEPGAKNEWDAYVSLKFEGPAYGGSAGENRVLVDRVILVSMT